VILCICQEEVLARLTAERRLQEADKTLTRLESVLHRQGIDALNMEQMKDEMIGDVKSLKSITNSIR